jgi:hypothetical protein
MLQKIRPVPHDPREQGHSPVRGPLEHPLARRLSVCDRLHTVLVREVEGPRPGVEQQKRSVGARKQSIVPYPTLGGRRKRGFELSLRFLQPSQILKRNSLRQTKPYGGRAIARCGCLCEPCLVVRQRIRVLSAPIASEPHPVVEARERLFLPSSDCL